MPVWGRAPDVRDAHGSGAGGDVPQQQCNGGELAGRASCSQSRGMAYGVSAGTARMRGGQSSSARRVLASVGGLSLPQAAATYAAAGMAVFPCAPAAKRPLTRRGLIAASVDPDQIAWWWRRWPDANIGLPAGQPGGFDVVDVDVRPTGSGLAALRQARQAGLLKGWAALVSTPSGGLHVYFPAGDRPQRSWVLPRAHVDFRGLGGYVVCPPSQARATDGPRRYRVIEAGAHPGPLDAAALRELLAPAVARRRLRFELDRAGWSGERLAAWLERQPEGNRNSALFWAACRHAERGSGEAQARALLGAAATRAGLGEREIEATLASAFRTVGRRSVESPAPGLRRP
jgi:Bifunctional DNA primase/polymerase, N-terminal